MIRFKNENIFIYFFCIVFFCFNNFAFGQNKEREPYKEEYLNYTPDFLEKIKIRSGTMDWRWWNRTEKEMETSSEIKFYTLNEVEEVNRANA